MTERQAALTSVNEYRLRVEGHERQIRQSWEIMRWQVWQLLSPNYRKGRAPKTPQQFCRFPWERTQQEEAEEMCRRSQVSAEEAAVLDALFEKRKQEEASS